MNRPTSNGIMHFPTSTTAAVAALLFSTRALACLHFNATLTDDHKLTVNSWDDSNNNDAVQPQDHICRGTDLSLVSGKDNQWSVPCDTHGTVFDVFLDKNSGRFLDIFFSYENKEAAGLNVDGSQDFFFNFRVGSRDGKWFKAREFCAQNDILSLIRPEALKNAADSN